MSNLWHTGNTVEKSEEMNSLNALSVLSLTCLRG